MQTVVHEFEDGEQLNSTQFSFNNNVAPSNNGGGIIVIDESKVKIQDKSARKTRQKYVRVAPIISGSPTV